MSRDKHSAPIADGVFAGGVAVRLGVAFVVGLVVLGLTWWGLA